MDKVLRPARFSVDPTHATAAREFRHWLRTFESFLAAIEDHEPDKLSTLTNFISSEVFEFIEDFATYDDALTRLKEIYQQPVHEVFARHILTTRTQQPGENVDVYYQSLRRLARDCNYQSVTADVHRDEAIRGAFIAGLSSSVVRQRLLETRSLTLEEAVTQAKTLEKAQHSAGFFPGADNKCNISATVTSTDFTTTPSSPTTGSEPFCASTNPTCFFCGNARHPRTRCPARDSTCYNCHKKGHFSKVCKSQRPSLNLKSTTSASTSSTLTTLAVCAASLNKSTSRIVFHGKTVTALFDSGSCECFVRGSLVKELGLRIIPSNTRVAMAKKSLVTDIEGHVLADITISSSVYKGNRFLVMPDLCYDVIIGQDFMNQHESIEILFGGSKPRLTVCGLAKSLLPAPNLFSNLSPDCRPIATQSRRFSDSDRKFIDQEIRRLLSEDVIEASSSPWRAQIVITSNERHKKRLVIDYSRTINRFTELDAYPLPRMDDLAQRVSKYKLFSTIDLKSAYHQIGIKECDMPYTAFEANGNLFHFKRLPFGVTNGVACFQRLMDNLIRENNLEGTFAYLDNVLICGSTKEEHDRNLAAFMNISKELNLTFNNDKCEFSKATIDFLGYTISNGTLRPDPERLRPLKELAVPKDLASLRRCLGLFSYYAAWIPRFSERIRPLAASTSFPISDAAVFAFNDLRDGVERSVLQAVDDSIPFVVETDASDFAIAATLNQAGRPVAFFSRTLTASERNHSTVEKEACAIVEALQKWRHYLIGRLFTLATDSKSVSFMFNKTNYGKTKNEKIQRWRLELSCFKYDIVHRAAVENIPADTFSRMCSSVNSSDLKQLHEDLCHPGVTRLAHFVKTKNLPHSIQDVRDVISKCTVCAELKPKFYRPPTSHLIKATQPFERLNMDFKGPLPASNRNAFILTIIDEYTRFPFAFACSDTSTATVISCLNQLFAIFGMPAYLHSDRGSSFMSKELADYLSSKGIATSRTTPYNPQSNGQTERYNGIIWNAVKLSLRSKVCTYRNGTSFCRTLFTQFAPSYARPQTARPTNDFSTSSDDLQPVIRFQVGWLIRRKFCCEDMCATQNMIL